MCYGDQADGPCSQPATVPDDTYYPTPNGQQIHVTNTQGQLVLTSPNGNIWIIQGTGFDGHTVHAVTRYEVAYEQFAVLEVFRTEREAMRYAHEHILVEEDYQG